MSPCPVERHDDSVAWDVLDFDPFFMDRLAFGVGVDDTLNEIVGTAEPGLGATLVCGYVRG